MSLVEYTPRLPVPPGQDAMEWRILTEVLYPNAKSQQSIILAQQYCRVRKLDILKKPVNIVSQWSSEAGRYVETLWPSIGETEITAARSEQWAGLDAPRYGDQITKQFTGQRKIKGSWETATFEVVFPEWCERTVYRLVNGVRQAFTERAHWQENYGRVGNSVLPNDMWKKRPYDQISKVAKAWALRAAFPEEVDNAPTDVEMQGQTVEEANVAAYEPPHTKLAPLQQPAPPENAAPVPGRDYDADTGEVIETSLRVPHQDGEQWQDWAMRFIAKVRGAPELDIVEAIVADNTETLAAMEAAVPKMHTGLKRSVNAHKLVVQPKEPLQ